MTELVEAVALTTAAVGVALIAFCWAPHWMACRAIRKGTAMNMDPQNVLTAADYIRAVRAAVGNALKVPAAPEGLAPNKVSVLRHIGLQLAVVDFQRLSGYTSEDFKRDINLLSEFVAMEQRENGCPCPNCSAKRAANAH